MKQQEQVDQLFDEWAFKWLNTRRLAALPVWQKNILDLSARGDRPDAYLSTEMCAFNRAVMSLEPIDFAALVYSSLAAINKSHPPAKTMAYQVGSSRKTLLDHIPRARTLVMGRFRDGIHYYNTMREEFGVEIIAY